MVEYDNMGGKTEEEYKTIPGIPQHMTGALYRYVEHGIGPGSFLTAVLCNDLKQAIQCADIKNIQCLKEWAQVMTWCVPAECQGSAELVKDWLLKKRKEIKNEY